MANFIDTQRLRLEPIGLRHVSETWLRWLNDMEVVRYSDQRFRTHTQETVRAYALSFSSGPDRLWAIMEKRENRHIGNISATIDLNHRTADLGILIGERSFWGQGFGPEAWSAVMEYLFDGRGIRKITAGTLNCNTGMISTALRSGMKEEGRRARQNLVDGREEDMVLFAAFADDWHRPPADRHQGDPE